MNIGVFDSGRGGGFIAQRLRQLLPEHRYIVANDSEHVPYGTRSQAEILQLTDQAIQPLITQCTIIVIACNTITTTAIRTLRTRYPHIQFIGLEPMLKPASGLTRTGHIIVLGTPATLHSQRYHELKKLYIGTLTVDEPATGNWPRLIEDGHEQAIDLDVVSKSIKDGADIVVLACTHYLALIPRLQHIPDVTILEPSEAIARRIQQLLAQPLLSNDQYGLVV